MEEDDDEENRTNIEQKLDERNQVKLLLYLLKKLNSKVISGHLRQTTTDLAQLNIIFSLKDFTNE